ncbi:PLC-like phosphodiesterase [Eremomyces bilateralis CBS 781.70]|uniref:PLC-like phosphodiesterase n=1 Tax=Eremomyces bilateralis CBS 781.70 TaxID=1392243 RepID=A0A6G1G5V3_9PEZI|nr:PLC-like phosphodiesterase [Eremomyces bilateralis CBS 781.70]KAF1813392.1 PLC-like phosphodiesterase [Eremomyces bilateralis CBS 781.70]
MGHLDQIERLYINLGSWPVPTSPPSAADPSRLCNGQSSYCSRKYTEIAFIGAHDSPFVGILPTQNQGLEVTEQLDKGVRYLQGQTQTDGGTLNLCHTACALEDAGPIEDYLHTVKAFLEGNPGEVVTLLFVNGDRTPIEEWKAAFEETGIHEYAYAPEKKPLPMGEWPTLGEMIDMGKRLVVFLDTGADQSKVPYLIDEFSHYFETPFGVTDPSFPDCSLDRPKSDRPSETASSRMYIVNHFLNVELLPGLKVPDRMKAPQTNAAEGNGGVLKQVGICQTNWERRPNVVLLDYVEFADVKELERILNRP